MLVKLSKFICIFWDEMQVLDESVLVNFVSLSEEFLRRGIFKACIINFTPWVPRLT